MLVGSQVSVWRMELRDAAISHCPHLPTHDRLVIIYVNLKNRCLRNKTHVFFWFDARRSKSTVFTLCPLQPLSRRMLASESLASSPGPCQWPMIATPTYLAMPSLPCRCMWLVRDHQGLAKMDQRCDHLDVLQGWKMFWFLDAWIGCWISVMSSMWSFLAMDWTGWGWVRGGIYCCVN